MEANSEVPLASEPEIKQYSKSHSSILPVNRQKARKASVYLWIVSWLITAFQLFSTGAINYFGHDATVVYIDSIATSILFYAFILNSKRWTVTACWVYAGIGFMDIADRALLASRLFENHVLVASILSFQLLVIFSSIVLIVLPSNENFVDSKSDPSVECTGNSAE